LETPLVRKLFIAGATGVVGRTVVQLAHQQGQDFVAQVRPKSASKATFPSKTAVCELSDPDALRLAMSGCTTVLQLIGTMRKRFEQGDTYETSDIGTTASLVSAAQGCGVDHFVLLSSAGTGHPFGAYLKAKAEAEALVKASGIPFTVFRPSAFTGADERHVPAFFSAAMRIFGLEKYQPIDVKDVARALLFVSLSRSSLNTLLEGRPLWDQVANAKRAEAQGKQLGQAKSFL
jgi:uncharacterized protein YbjT (DUF2867 family)